MGLAIVLSGCEQTPEPSVSTAELVVLGLAEDAETSGRTTQANLLRDGAVSEADYRQAYADAVSCMERQGMVMVYLELVPTETGAQMEMIVDNGTLDEVRASEVSNACEIEHDSLVAQGWQAQQGGEFVPAAATDMQACLAQSGVSAGDAETLEDFVLAAGGDFDAVEACLADVRATLRDQAGVAPPPM